MHVNESRDRITLYITILLRSSSNVCDVFIEHLMLDFITTVTPEERRQKNALNAPYFVVALKDTEILLNTFLRFMIRVKGNPNPVVKL